MATSDWIAELPSFVRGLVGQSEPEWVDVGAELSDVELDVVIALEELGLDRHAAVDAVRTDGVALALARHQRRVRTRYTLDELAERSTVPRSVLVDLQVAMGLELPEAYTKDDLEWAQSLRRMLEVVPPAALIRSARSRGAALASIARADLSLIRDELVRPLRQEGADDLTVAVALAEASQLLGPLSAISLVHGYERHLDHELASEVARASATSANIEVPVSIGFVDLVGYTALSAQIDPTGLDRLLDRFESRCTDVVHPVEGVSIVKYLGDAVMLVASAPAPLAEVMLALTESIPELEDAPLRGGMAHGPVVVREGDYFGSPVNLAARLTDMARPWSVLADQELTEELDGFDVVPTRPMQLRGFGSVRPLAVRSGSAA